MQGESVADEKEAGATDNDSVIYNIQLPLPGVSVPVESEEIDMPYHHLMNL